MEDCDVASLEEKLRSRFVHVLALLLPPCTSACTQPPSAMSTPRCTTPSASPATTTTANFTTAVAPATVKIHQLEDESEDPENTDDDIPTASFEWTDNQDAADDPRRTTEIVALLLASAMGFGGQLFNLCVDVLARQPSQSHFRLQRLIQSTLASVLMDYKCGVTHVKQETSLDLSSPSDMQETECVLTRILRTAALMVAANEVWWVTEPCEEMLMKSKDSLFATLPMNDVKNALEGICEETVSLAQRVAAARDNTCPTPSLRCSRNPRKQRRGGEDLGEVLCAQEKWFAVNDDNSFPKLEEIANIGEVFHAGDSTFRHTTVNDKESINSSSSGSSSSSSNEIANNGSNNNVDHEELSEVGNVLAVINETCEARTLLGISAWQYGRNRISLASLTVIMQQVPETEQSTKGNEERAVAADNPAENGSNNNNNDGPARKVVENENEDGKQELLGYFVHETGTLYTAQGRRYFMESN